MKKILLSVSMIAFVGALVAGATGAFFSDSETSTGNVLAAGAIDLGIDNESYYNGVLNNGTSWELDFDLDGGVDQQVPNPAYQACLDANQGLPELCIAIPQTITVPRLFFNFDDLKPGDYGEDTISIHVNDNASWLCADVKLTSNDDNNCVEPEVDAEGVTCGNDLPAANSDGDLAQGINFLWWADDGDNVLESDETPLQAGALGALGVGNTAYVALADATGNIWGDVGPLPQNSDTRYIGKAWCFGPIVAAPVEQDEETNVMSPAGNNDGNDTAGQPTDGGYTCSGVNVGNEAQTDSATLDITFRAVQSRNNAGFLCAPLPA